MTEAQCVSMLCDLLTISSARDDEMISTLDVHLAMIFLLCINAPQTIILAECLHVEPCFGIKTFFLVYLYQISKYHTKLIHHFFLAINFLSHRIGTIWFIYLVLLRGAFNFTRNWDLLSGAI